MNALSQEDEIARIKSSYQRRKGCVPEDRYSLFGPGNLFMVQQRDRALVTALGRVGITGLGDRKILEVGCGSGGELRNLLRLGARPGNLHGIDLLPERIEQAKAISPNMVFHCGDASALPFESRSFDLVFQFTVFTSVLSGSMKRDIAREMVRVLKDDGIIVWYDYHVDNPRNSDVRGVGKREISKLFPGCHISLRRINLAPPITRRLAPYSLLCCYLLEMAKILNTHYMGVIRRASS